MTDGVFVASPALPPIDQKATLRYLNVKNSTAEVLSLLREMIAEAESVFSARACWCEVTVERRDCEVDLGFTRVASRSLAAHLAGCDRAVVFAATVGLEIDRLIAKYSRLSPARALCLQAIGTERIETLCDLLCASWKEAYCAEGKRTRTRFSPGYGDLPLAMQSDIFRLLDAPKRIGLSLNDSLLMSPTKSVTAIVGIERSLP
ncbi:MAG: Vitamin B12 dependent methionine synthase activation subunit [Clostridia bacterium]|nr:Vitamin B12 dependent methionine synthase activation subunit [Clostridia bacterium]